MKNKWLKILIVLALFLPTVVAVINFATAQNAPISHKNVSKVVLTAPDGREDAFTRDSVKLDTSELDIEQVLAEMKAIIGKKIPV